MKKILKLLKNPLLYAMIFILLVVAFIIVFSVKNRNPEKLIINAIQKDQDYTGDYVLLYTKPIKMNEIPNDKDWWKEKSKNCDFYYVMILNDKEQHIIYFITIENNEVTWCQEIE